VLDATEDRSEDRKDTMPRCLAVFQHLFTIAVGLLLQLLTERLTA
jgi:hypothetical protein